MTAVAVAPVSTPAPAIRRVLWGSYAFQLFFGLLLWVPIFYEYQRDLGLTDEQIFGIQSIYYVAFCLLEIPTGLIADRFDYRHALAAGGAVLVAANLLPVLSPTYGGFLAHFLLIALARALVSGAASAYLYEYLHRAGRDDMYLPAEGRGRAYSLIGKVIGWPVVGVVMLWAHSSPYWLTAIASAISVAAAIALPRMLPAKAAEQDSAVRPRRPSVLQGLRGSLGAVKASRLLLLVMLQGIAIFTLARIATVNLFQPILLDKQVPVVLHGTVMAAMTVAEAAGAARCDWIRRWMSDVKAIFALTAVLTATLTATVLTGGWGTVVLLCVFALAAGVAYPVQKQLLGDAITTPQYR
ncbi:MAG: MFS transporter, partial [Stackebrandtia sp.]